LTPPTAPLIPHKFNHDLLLALEDQRAARISFPAVAFALDHQRLREIFQSHDDPANAAKKRSRRLGLLAVALAVLALSAAATESLYRSHHEVAVVVVALASLAGIGSTLIGLFGVMFAGTKREWLHRRLITERLRQLHFQTQLDLLPDLLAAANDPGQIPGYQQQRETRLVAFTSRFVDHAEAQLEEMLQEEDGAAQTWLAGKRPRGMPGARDPLFDEFSRAYRELRLIPQLQYANYQLRAGGLGATRQAFLLSTSALWCALAILASHALMVGGVVAKFEPLAGPIPGTVALIIALVALALRTIEEGLQPNREIERYRHYRSGLRMVESHWQEAQSPEQVVAAMLELEELSYNEMKNFLRAHSEARFVM
jgi:hypothetical protein